MSRKKKPFERGRWLSVTEVANDILRLTQDSQENRNRQVVRWLRKLEQRDGVVYLHRLPGKRAGAPLMVNTLDLERLDPYNPAASQVMQEEIKALNAETRRLKRRLDQLEDFADQVTAWLRSPQACLTGPH